MKNKVLLSMLACLVLIRFLIVPALDWRENEQLELKAVSKQLGKVLALLPVEAVISQSLEDMQPQVDLLSQQLQQTTDYPSLSLQLQTQWQQFAKSNSVEFDLFNWVAQKKEIDAGVYSALITARMAGSYPAIAKSLNQIDSMPGVAVTDIKLNWRNNFAPASQTNAEIAFQVLYQERAE